MEFVSIIFGPVANSLTGPIRKHLGYVTSSTKHINNMRKKMMILDNMSADVNWHIERNLINCKEVPVGVHDWLYKVMVLKDKVESIPSDGFGCLNTKMRYLAGRKACMETERIEELITEHSEFIWSDAQRPMGRVSPMPASSTREDRFKSREVPFNDALKFLQEDHNKGQVIALCGVGGVGKTSMMEQLIKVAKENKMFDYIVKVVIGMNSSILSIQNDIAQYLQGESLLEGSVETRAVRLSQTFKKMLEDGKRKILLILDDVWKKVELEDIGLTSPLSNGIKLLLTSRNSEICKQIATDANLSFQLVRVDVLEEVEAQNFFSRITGVSEDNDHDLYQIGCDIVKKCGYVPLAIMLVSAPLKSKNMSEWRSTLQRLNNDYINKDMQHVMMISYKYLKKEERKILLLCGLFPKDSHIPIEYLTRYAWGLKLLKDVSTLGEAREMTKTYVHNLINASLLICSDDLGCVEMSDLVLAFVLGRVSTKNHPWIINHGNNKSKWDRVEMQSCKTISLNCMGIPQFPSDFKYPYLSLMQLMDGDYSLNFLEDFYEHTENLEVLAYYKIQNLLLPRSLENLKTLCLQKCKLMFDCSFVGDLVHLEVLSFVHCCILKLPSTIGNLKRLKLLDLTGCAFECADIHIDDGVFRNLDNLEELYMRASHGKPIRFTYANIEELAMHLKKLCVLEVEFVEKTRLGNVFSKKLDKFSISIGCELENQKDTENYSFQNTLKLVTDHNSDLLECKINEMFKKTEKLHLQVKDVIHLKDVLPIQHDGQHPFFNLRDLEVCDCAKLKYLFTVSMASGLRNLERLKIWSCSALEALVRDDGNKNNRVVEMIKFEKLQFVSLKKLPMLESLFPLDSVVELPQLVELEVDWLPRLTSIYRGKNNFSSLMTSQFSQVGVVSWSLCQYSRTIYIHWCNALSSVIPSYAIHQMQNLEALEVRNCKSLTEVFETQGNNNNNNDSGGGGGGSIDIDEGSGGIDTTELVTSRLRSTNVPQLSNLKKLVIISCNLLQHVFTFSSLKSLTQLEELTISKCKTIKVIVKEENRVQENVVVFPRVKCVELSDLPNLNGFFLGMNEFQWPLLEKVMLKECPQMMVFTSGRSTTPELKYIHTRLGKHSLECGLNFHVATDIQETHLPSSEITSLLSTTLERLPAWTFHNLIELHMKSLNWQVKKIIPSSELPQLQKLETIQIYDCHYVEVVFELEAMEGKNGESRTVQVPNLTQVELKSLWSLEYIWESNHHVLEFPNLTTVSICSCDRLEHVFTISMVGSLLQLRDLQISDCRNMEVVVKEEKEQSACDAKVNEIVKLHRLKSLKLKKLRSLIGFFLGKDDFSCPSLHTLEILECPKITVFTEGDVDTPALKIIDTSFGRCNIREGVNAFIKTKRYEGGAFSLEELSDSE